jgi:hypothetical protein
MVDFLLKILDWSEVWALIIPLIVLLFNRRQPTILKPIIIYLWLAFILNLSIDIIFLINVYYHKAVMSNNFLYNIHSVVRLVCFCLYFNQLSQASFTKFKKGLAAVSVVFIVINFSIFEKFFNYDTFSGNLLSAEAYILLVYCMLYYLTELKNDSDNLFNTPHFWIVTGLSIYVVINFFVFLFYIPMFDVDANLAANIWHVHNIAFIIFCLFITKGLYGSHRYKYSV